MWEVIVTEVSVNVVDGHEIKASVERYRQVVETLSLPAVIKAVNSIPRGRPRQKAKE